MKKPLRNPLSIIREFAGFSLVVMMGLQTWARYTHLEPLSKWLVNQDYYNDAVWLAISVFSILSIPSVMQELKSALKQVLSLIREYAIPEFRAVKLLEQGGKVLALQLLDRWGAMLPIRVNKEELGDYMEDIERRAKDGQRWMLWVRVITAIIWTGINTVGFVSKNLLGKEAESRSNKQPSK